MANPIVNGRQKRKSLSTAIQELEAAVKGFQSYSKDFQTVENLQSEVSSLKLQLADKGKELSEEKSNIIALQNLHENLSTHHEQRHATWLIQKEKLIHELSDCQASLETSQKSRHLDLEVRMEDLEIQNSQQAHEIDEQKTMIKGLETRLTEALDNLTSLERKIGWQKIESDLYLFLRWKMGHFIDCLQCHGLDIARDGIERSGI